MRLDRFTSPDGKGRYSIIDNRTGKIVHNGDPHDDFVVLKLKDWYVAPTLQHYAVVAGGDGQQELAADFVTLSEMSYNHPDRKRPD